MAVDNVGAPTEIPATPRPTVAERAAEERRAEPEPAREPPPPPPPAESGRGQTVDISV